MTAKDTTFTQPSSGLSSRRRSLLRAAGGTALLGLAAPLRAQSVVKRPAFGDYPFTLGVASGDPAPDGFVIWTKLAPKPLEQEGGLPNKAVEVEWSIASDETMRQIVRQGSTLARPELGHAVHVELEGLAPGREYFYRFTAGGETSPVGRARTFPALGSTPAELRFAAAGCQKYEDGYYSAWRHLADERLDFVFHYGDYIYEYNTRPGSRKLPVIRTVPGAVTQESYTLDDYRRRYAAYKSDPDLQAAHASAPFIMSFDDHEVDNNWAGEVSSQNAPTAQFLLRRAAAFQAWYENMPVRRAQLPRGPDILAYRRLIVGNLLAMNVLDTRQYRSDQACGDGARTSCPEARDAARTMLGQAQEQWLYDGFRTSDARWTLLAQQVPIMQRDLDPDPALYTTHMDKWDGAVAARDRLFAAARDAKIANLVAVTGDVHLNCVGELKRDFADPASNTIGVEFVGTSITSGGDGSDTSARLRALQQQDPHIKFYNRQRGYVRHTVSPRLWQADYRVLDKVSSREGNVSTRASFVVEAGKPGVSNA